MRRFLPGATSFKSWSSVRFESVLLALSKMSRHELIATCTDNLSAVTGISPLFRCLSFMQPRQSAISLALGRLLDFQSGHRQTSSSEVPLPSAVRAKAVSLIEY